MEVEEFQPGSKFPMICNFAKNDNTNNKTETKSNTTDFNPSGPLGRFCGWPQSRIVRVSRASGGKDRHSKVWTSKGLRDRRVRLSVHTAIQFYDLQDRLGYDQPSKAVEWLLKAAAKSIDELPEINTSFPDTPRQVSDEREQVESAQLNSSNSEETSKGSGGLSLSRTENRVKARERAKERKAEREKERDDSCMVQTSGHNLQMSQSSFTELLTGTPEGSSFFPKHHRQWGSDSAMDYFPISPYQNQIHNEHHHHHHQEMQHFSLLPDHMMPTVAATSADLSFTMSSNRGTLQSNSPQSMLLPHHHHHIQRLDGYSVPFFIGTAAPTAVPLEQQFPSGLQLYYGDGNARHLDHKGKGNN